MASKEKNLEQQNTINPYLYAYYGKLDLSDLNRADYKRFIKHIKDLPQYDGEGERTVFFKIVDIVPKREEDIEKCKKFNAIQGQKVMKLMVEMINKTGRYTAEWTKPD
jgi:DNA-directed RNA polymerase subunit F